MAAKKTWALRISEEDLAEIKARAERAELSTTQYMIRAALGELDTEPATLQQQIDATNARLDRLERLAELDSAA